MRLLFAELDHRIHHGHYHLYLLETAFHGLQVLHHQLTVPLPGEFRDKICGLLYADEIVLPINYRLTSYPNNGNNGSKKKKNQTQS